MSLKQVLTCKLAPGKLKQYASRTSMNLVELVVRRRDRCRGSEVTEAVDEMTIKLGSRSLVLALQAAESLSRSLRARRGDMFHSSIRGSHARSLAFIARSYAVEKRRIPCRTYCFQNRFCHKDDCFSVAAPGTAAEGATLDTGTTCGGTRSTAVAANGTDEVATTGSTTPPAIAGNGIAPLALLAILLPNSPESTALSLAPGQNLHVANAVAVPIESRIQIPATRNSSRALLRSACQASLSFAISVSALSSRRFARPRVR